MHHESIKDRLVEVVKMDQHPKDRLWAAIVVLTVIALLSAAITAIYAETTRTLLQENRSLDYKIGSINCLQVVIDNDRNFELPPYCAMPEVIVFFPPEVCEEYYPNRHECAINWDNIE